jgi:hypothetical protein
MQQPNFFISFWHICLSNLTEGSFVHHCLSPEEAKKLIAQAQQNQTLLCVAQDDLLAPYKQREAQKYQELCTALQQYHGISLELEDFLLKDEEEGAYSTTPLQIVQVEGDAKLLVISCNYAYNSKHQRGKDEAIDLNTMFAIAPDSIEFHLIEAIDS